MLQDSQAYSGFSIKNAAVAKQFYGEVLGLNITDVSGMEDYGILELKIKDGPNLLLYSRADHRPADFTVLNFPVLDINATIDELNAKGIEMIQYDNPDIPQDDKGVLRGLSQNMGPDIAWFTDPSGNILAVQQTA